MDKSSSKTLKDILRPYQILSYILGIRLIKFPSGWKSIKLNKWESSIRRLEEIDKTLQALGSNSRFHKIYVRTMIELIFSVIFFLALICSDGFYITISIDSKIIKTILLILIVIIHVYGEIIASTITMDFLTMVRCVKSELERASDLLIDINILPSTSIAVELIKYKRNKKSNTKFFKVLPSSQRINSRLDASNQEIFRSRRLLQTIRQIHLELYKVSKNLNDLYGIQVFIIICLYFFYNTCFFYSTYTFSKNSGYIKQIFLQELGSIAYFFFSTIYKVIFINYTCDETTLKMEKINEIIYTFYAENTDYIIQQEVKMFTLQMAHCQSTYSTFVRWSDDDIFDYYDTNVLAGIKKINKRFKHHINVDHVDKKRVVVLSIFTEAYSKHRPYLLK
ncbi:putative gustatory receptor 28b [Vespula squamosa]|uniref:Gustatory receptor n=1 Tax=Vespula squamosa TaxID=30214 RepID=A0ABD2AXY7_VESSQ